MEGYRVTTLVVASRVEESLGPLLRVCFHCLRARADIWAMNPVAAYQTTDIRPSLHLRNLNSVINIAKKITGQGPQLLLTKNLGTGSDVINCNRGENYYNRSDLNF